MYARYLRRELAGRKKQTVIVASGFRGMVPALCSTLLLCWVLLCSLLLRGAVFSDDAPGRRRVALVFSRGVALSSERVVQCSKSRALRWAAANLEAYNPLARAADCRDFWRGNSTVLGFGRPPITVGPAVY